MKDVTVSADLGLSVGQALRHNLFNKITPILLSSDFIGDNTTRDLIRSNCLDMVTLIEAIIKQFGLDQGTVSHDK